MSTSDFGVIAPDLLVQKILNAQTIKEAAALVQLCHQDYPVLSKTTRQPVDWGIERPLCQHCWQELAQDNGFCWLCQEIFHRIETSPTKANTGILVSSPYANDISNTLPESLDTFQIVISKNELLVLLPQYKVAEISTALSENAPYPDDPISIVFPSWGDMIFGDALAMARYIATNSQFINKGLMIKFFFSHAHMRSFDFEDFFPFQVTETLFEMAKAIKSVFSRQDRSVIWDLLKKDQVNRVYEFNRFYSMCNQDQKSILSQIFIDDLEPSRARLLLQLVRHVY